MLVVVIVVVIDTVVVGVVVAVTAVSVLVTGDAVAAATRTVDSLVGWSLAKCSFTGRNGACPVPMKEHSTQPQSTLAAG